MKLMKTHGDKIRTMTDEELADAFRRYMCPYALGAKMETGCVGQNCSGSCYTCWLDWLKREVESDG